MDTVARSRALAGVPLFERLPRLHRDRVAAEMGVREFGAGESLLRQGEPGDCVLVLVKGGVSVCLRRGGGDVVLAKVGPGAVLGEMALVTGAPRTADAIATEDGRALVLDTAAFRALAAEIPEIVDLLTEVVAERLGRAAHDGLGDKVIEGYRIVRPVGRGGMSVVYEAERLDDGLRVALKMMSHLFARNANALARFDREAQILAGFRHDAITRCHGRFPAYGTVFLVMEFVDGPSLEEVLAVSGPLPEAEARSAFGAIATALAHVHRHGVVHGDLKPANVLVDALGAMRLTDFGIAQPIRDDESPPVETGRPSGTPHFMAPEQFGGAAPSRVTDLYALGCILAELLTGRPAVDAPTLSALISRKRSFDPRGYAQGIRGASDEIRGVVASLLSPAPEMRAIDLDRWARGAAPMAPARVAAARVPGLRPFDPRRPQTTLGT